MEAHKHVPAEVLHQALSGADLEQQPLDSSLALVPEQTGVYTALFSTCFLLYKLYTDLLCTTCYQHTVRLLSSCFVAACYVLQD